MRSFEPLSALSRSRPTLIDSSSRLSAASDRPRVAKHNRFRTRRPGTFLGTAGDGAKLYDYDFGIVASATQTFTVTNNGTGASNMLQVIFGGDTGYVFANNTCENQLLAPNGTCTFDLTFTAPAGCNPGDPFPGHVDVFGFPDHYIHLETVGHCS